MGYKTGAVLIARALFTVASVLQAEEQPTPIDRHAVRVACETTDFVREPGIIQIIRQTQYETTGVAPGTDIADKLRLPFCTSFERSACFSSPS